MVLDHEGTAAMTTECLTAVLASVGVGPTDRAGLHEVLVADNGSVHRADEVRAAVAAVAAHAPAGTAVRWEALGRNWGFAGGVNRAVQRLDPSCDLVFLLNSDAAPDPDALRRCADTLLDADASTVAVAPKMLIVDAEDGGDAVIDSIGNAVNARGEAFNVGLGQPDLGQYDVPAPCFGACFGAAMIRRDAFRPDRVGPLRERWFLYYEDVEWSWRARLLGYDCITAPSAVVRHAMSTTSRRRGYGFKFHLTERNLLLTVLELAPWRDVARIWSTRGIGLLLGTVKGHYPLPGLKALGGAVRRAPATLLDRRRILRRAVRDHAHVLSFGREEQTFFDPVAYEPNRRAEAREFAEARFAKVRAQRDR